MNRYKLTCIRAVFVDLVAVQCNIQTAFARLQVDCCLWVARVLHGYRCLGKHVNAASVLARDAHTNAAMQQGGRQTDARERAREKITRAYRAAASHHRDTACCICHFLKAAVLLNPAPSECASRDPVLTEVWWRSATSLMPRHYLMPRGALERPGPVLALGVGFMK